MQRGLYSVDVLIERRGEVIDSRLRCSLLRVGTGKIVARDFYLEHSCQLRQLKNSISPEPGISRSPSGDDSCVQRYPLGQFKDTVTMTSSNRSHAS